MATIDDTVGKLARVYDSQTDTWIPLVGSPVPHVHNVSSSPDVDITEPLSDNEILQYSTSASAFINKLNLTISSFENANHAHNSTTGGGRLAADAVLYDTDAKTASYTLELSDLGKVVRMDVSTANNLTVPPNSSVEFPIGSVVNIVQIGTGQTTIVAGSGVTLRSANNLLKIVARYGLCGVIKIGTDEWVVFGNLAS